jgi:hypothetical protein
MMQVSMYQWSLLVTSIKSHNVNDSYQLTGGSAEEEPKTLLGEKALEGGKIPQNPVSTDRGDSCPAALQGKEPLLHLHL